MPLAFLVADDVMMTAVAVYSPLHLAYNVTFDRLVLHPPLE